MLVNKLVPRAPLAEPRFAREIANDDPREVCARDDNAGRYLYIDFHPARADSPPFSRIFSRPISRFRDLGIIHPSGPSSFTVCEYCIDAATNFAESDAKIFILHSLYYYIFYTFWLLSSFCAMSISETRIQRDSTLPNCVISCT